jgi:hypothetical protein
LVNKKDSRNSNVYPTSINTNVLEEHRRDADLQNQAL